MRKSFAALIAAALCCAPVTASADEGVADIAVEVTAARNILPTDGWSTVTTTVRNVGSAPAENVTFTTTLPPELRSSGTSTSSEWKCDHGIGTVTCTRETPLAPGEAAYPFHFSTYAQGATVGQTVAPRAEAGTTSPEIALDNNRSAKDIRFVGKGVIKGNFWHDLDADGVREDGEPLVEGPGISFWSVDDEDHYGFANTHRGEYSFQVPAKRYVTRMEVWASEWKFTTPNVGDDRFDSDVIPTKQGPWTNEATTDPFLVEQGGTVVIDVGLVAVQMP